LNSERPLRTSNQRYFRQSRYGLDKFVLVRHQKVHYIEAGEGQSVVLVSGSPSSYRLWGRLMPLLSTHYRLLALDYGEIEDHSAEQIKESVYRQGDLIAAMLKQLNLEKVSLIGAGRGGITAFNLAARYPDLVERVAGLSAHIGLRPESQPNVENAPHPKPDKADALEADANLIKCPVLYLYGTHHTAREFPLNHNLEYLQKNHSQAWIVALEGGLFDVALNRAQEITALLQDFLKFKPGLRIT
jgi:pimeloyl-ACP methyl ester carboxylesterase